jgi:Mn2+/Fe2+ NRAMP family transporter
VDRTRHISVDGRRPTYVRAAGHGHGRGLAAAVRIHYPRWVLWGACSILVVANVINIGADLGGMAEATQLVTGIRSFIWIPFYAFLIIGLLFWTSYKLIARISSG